MRVRYITIAIMIISRFLIYRFSKSFNDQERFDKPEEFRSPVVKFFIRLTMIDFVINVRFFIQKLVTVLMCEKLTFETTK